MPEARRAISSLSEDNRPTAIRIAKRNDIGTVRTTMLGRFKSSSLPTVSTATSLPMIRSAERKRTRNSSMKV